MSKTPDNTGPPHSVIDARTGSRPSAAELLASERAAQRAFADSRCRVYVPRPAVIARLDQHVVQAGAPLVVCAPSGAGKSALIAYWCERLRREHADVVVIEHYVVGAGDLNGTMRHILLELADRFPLPDPIPATPEALQGAFAGRLWGTRGHVLVIAIDGADRFRSDAEGAAWLPEAIPPWVRLVVTTTDERLRDALAARGWETMILEPLTVEERRQIAEKYIADHAPVLPAGIVRGVANDAGSANPLMLRTRLEEMRRDADETDADAAIAYFLEARTLDEMYDRVLERLERNHGRPIVRDVMTLLVAARDGMRQPYLEHLSGADPGSLHLLLDALQHHLLPRGDALVFYHDYYLQRTIRNRYGDAVQAAHASLADYFLARLGGSGRGDGPESDEEACTNGEPVCGLDAMEMAELAYQLRSLGRADALRGLLLRIDVMAALSRGERQYDFLIYWRELIEGIDIVGEYRKRIGRFRAHADAASVVDAIDALGAFVHNIGEWEFAEELYTDKYRLATAAGDRAQCAEAAGVLGRLRQQKGDHAAALVWFEQQLVTATGLDHRRQMAIALGNIGTIHAEQGRYRQALECHHRQHAIAESIGDSRQIVKSTAQLGKVHDLLGDYAAALGCYSTILEEAERTGDRNMQSFAAATIGRILRAQGDHLGALGAHRRKFTFDAEVGDRRGMSVALGNMGLAYFELDDYDNAIACYEEGLRLAEELGYRRQIVWLATAIGSVHASRGQRDRALEYFGMGGRVAEELGDETYVAYAIGNAAIVRLEEGEEDEAWAMLQDALARHRAIGHRFGVADWLYHRARLMLRAVPATPNGQHRDPRPHDVVDAAARSLEECIELSRAIGRHDTLVRARVLQARTLFLQGEQALALHRLAMLSEEQLSDADRAACSYEAGMLQHSLAGGSEGWAELKGAMDLYARLAARTGNAEYAERHSVLARMVNGAGMMAANSFRRYQVDETEQ
ncbi:MAG TPA: tetratricopeptide repeat protein [Candidatus Kapabacteria bacterium]|nr:tetratricopeptide repeat protein [Candidatus Kapabacteria bacterium]